MSDLATVKELRVKLEAAEKAVLDASEAAITEELKKFFTANPYVAAIQWAQKSSEYNDEGMYPGVHGPIIGSDDDHEWLYSYGETPVPAELKSLGELLDEIGEDVLSDIYDDDAVVTVTREGQGFRTTTEYAGY